MGDSIMKKIKAFIFIALFISCYLATAENLHAFPKTINFSAHGQRQFQPDFFKIQELFLQPVVLLDLPRGTKHSMDQLPLLLRLQFLGFSHTLHQLRKSRVYIGSL